MRQTADTLDTRVLIRPTRSGAWIVRDGRGENGGFFRDRAAALKFIRREFGATVEPLESSVEPIRSAA